MYSKTIESAVRLLNSRNRKTKKFISVQQNEKELIEVLRLR